MRRFPLVKVIAIGSSLTLVAIFVLYRGGVIHVHRGSAAKTITSPESTSAPPASGFVESERPPEFFYGSKFGPVIVPENSNDRLIDITSKSGRILNPDDVSKPDSDDDTSTGDETP